MVALGIVAVLASLAGLGAADDGKVAVPFNGKNLDGWKIKGPEKGSQWKVGVAKLDAENPARLALSPAEGQAGEMVNLVPPHSFDIYTRQKFADATISLEIMIPKGSNSGVYVMGEYEIQVLDSFGKTNVGPGDMGGLYGANAPKVNASKAPGQWQKMVIEFVAPKFENGKKVANAKFLKVTLNGQVIHENVEMKGATPGGVAGKEVPEGPLMFQGNHGAVAYRNIKICEPAR
jgi:hypothetical protein